MLALGITAANTRRFDTDVPRMLFDAVQDLESDLELPRGRHIYGRADIWPHLQKMYEGYIAEPSLAAHHGGWQSAYAAVAYLAGKYDVARQQLEAVDWTPAPRNLVDWGTDLSLMPWEVAARTSPVGPQINTAEARRDRGDTADALRIYTGLKTAANLDERTQTFIADRLATLDLEARLQKGGWVDFLPSGDRFTGWCAARGRWQSLPDGALEVQSGHDGHILYSRARIGTEFEVKGEFETVRSSTKAFQAGMVMGIPEYDAFGWDAFRLKRNDDEGEVISFSQHWTRNQVFNRIKLNSSTNSFYFRLRAGKVSASVNGDEILRSVTPPANRLLSTNEFLLGLGAFNDMNDTVVRYRNIQIRKL
jgi:hypothetical protein